MVDVIGFIANRTIAEREGVPRDRASQLALLGTVVGGPGLSLRGVVLTQAIARREAPPAAPPSDGLVVVPDIVGRSAGEAEKVLRAASFDVVRETEASRVVPLDTVIRQQPAAIRQQPAAEARLTAGATVTIVISTGTKVPDTRGKPQAEADTLVDEAGLVLAYRTLPFEGVAKGFVAGQDPPAGTVSSAGRTVTLTISFGPGVIVPDLINQTYTDAAAALKKLKLIEPKRVDQAHPAYTGEFVFDQNPRAGEIAAKTVVVELTVSTDPGPVTG